MKSAKEGGGRRIVRKVMNCKRNLMWAAALMLPLMPLCAATYYVDPAVGNDANSGTATNAAWQSLAKVSASTFAPGDVIRFKSGQTNVGSLNPKGSGAAGNPIVIDQYGTGSKPLIDGNGVNGTGTTGGGAVFLYNQEYWEINNLEVVNDAASDGERRGIHIAAANYGTVNHIYIKNCHVHNIRGRLSTSDGDLVAKRTGGIIVETISDSSTPTRFNDVLIEGNTITTVRNQGIVAANNRSGASDFPLSSAWNARRASNLILRSNTISDVTKNALILRLADNTCLVEWNVCFNTATLDTGNTMFTAACNGVVFQFNEGYENHAGPLGDHDGSLYDADLRSTSITFQYSYSHDNAHGLFWQYPSASGPNSNIVVRYNISRNDRGNIFSFSGDSGGEATTYIYNNTIYLPPGSSNLICDARSGTHTYYMSNNIFHVLGNGVAYDFGSNTRVFDYNTFFGLHPASEPPDAHKLTNDPLIVAVGSGTNGIGTLAGWKLQAGSPCINSGVTIAGNPRDFFGVSVPQNGATDRGAAEYFAVVTNTPPSISQPPQSLNVTNASPASFFAAATGTAPLAYQWRKDGAPIGGATATNHLIAAASTNDAGSYDVVVTNVAGAMTSSVATLTIYIPPTGNAPTITTNPQNQSVSPGANVMFTAAANGTAPLMFQWRKGSVPIAGATNNLLALSNVTTNDAGGFSVVVTNLSGATTSAVATLTVAQAGTNSAVNPADYINPRFANVIVTSGVKFADVFNYKGVPTSLFLDVYEPTGDTNTSRPAIVWVHGGGFRTGSSRTQSYIVTYATEFARRGYACFAIDYRLRSGSDMPTQADELPAEQDGAADCNTAFHWVRTNAATYAVNTNWLFVGGGSAGGRIANVFSLHEGPDSNVCASCTSASLSNGVNTVPPVAWNRSGLIASASLWGAPEPVMRWYSLQSNDTPTVIIHGTADTTIPYQNALDLYGGMTNVGATVELDPLVGYGHTPTSANSQIIPWVANFFAQEWTKKLTPPVAPPSVAVPPQITNVLLNGSGLQFAFTNVPGASFTVLSTTNLALPAASWEVLGPMTESPAGRFTFIDTNAPAAGQRFYQVHSP